MCRVGGGGGGGGQKGAYDTLLGQEGRTKKGQGAAPRHSALGETLHSYKMAD